MAKRLRFIFGCIFFALAFLYVGVNMYRYVPMMRHDVGFATRGSAAGRIFVSGVSPGGPAAGALQADDEIVAVDNIPMGQVGGARGILRRVSPGEDYTLTVRRRAEGGAAESETRNVALRTQPVPTSGVLLNLAGRLYFLLPFLLAAFIVFALKPFDKAAFLLAMMLVMFVVLPQWLDTGRSGLPVWLWATMQIPRWLAYILLAPFFLHFFLIFPETRPPLSPALRRWPRAERFIYLPFLAMAVAMLVITIVITLTFMLGGNGQRIVDAIGPSAPLIGISLFLLYILLGLASLVVNYRQADEAERRRFRIIVFGAIAGFFPLVALLILSGLGFGYDNSRVARVLDQSVGLTLSLAPLSFAYAIIRHKVIPISLIIRQGVRYLFVLRGFYIVQCALIFFAIFFLFNSGFGRWIDSIGSRADIAATIAAGAAAFLLAWLINRRVVPAIDRRFFREAYDAQVVLSDLGQAVRNETSIERMLELAVARIEDALHPASVSVFLRDAATGDYPLAVSSSRTEATRAAVLTTSPPAVAPSVILPSGAFVVETLRESSETLKVDFQKEDSWAQKLLAGDNDARRREADALREVRAALLIPVRTKDHLLGILSLGERLGDLPYSGEDERLLSNVALQMAYAIENAVLIRRTVEEEKLKQDVEMATEVQQRLLPERPPVLDALDLAGSSQPARGIGGDYYDFLEIDANRTGICVADVAGKGVSAALLMSIVQALLRSQAPTAKNLTELVTTINRLMTRSTGSRGYATFFYAQFDAHTRALTYVNAGHNPPVLVRRAQREGVAAQTATSVTATGGESITMLEAGENGEAHFNLLTTGGPVIGMFEHFTFEEETVQLEAGDVLVAFSDGLSEAMSPAGEEFGEAHINRLAAEWSHLSAQGISDKIAEDVRAWCLDAPQHDDLTFIVAKVK